MYTFVFASTDDGFGIGSFLMSFIGLLTGPVAEFFAVVLILTGGVLFIRGHEGHEGLQKLGMIGIGVGLLATIPNIWAHFHGSTGIGI
jgi:type IV secretory pathway VirB2 component (pilin)